MPAGSRAVSPARLIPTLEQRRVACENRPNRGESIVSTEKHMSEGQRAYEAKRAAKAGMSLEKWLAAKEKEKVAEQKAREKAAEPPKPPKPPGFFARLIERAHRPLGS